MGADLIGYHYCGPKEFSEEVLSKASALYDRLRSRIVEVRKGLDDAGLLIDQTTETEYDAETIVLEELFKELNCNEPSYMDDATMDFSSAIHEYENGEDFIQNLISVWRGSGRDVSARYATVGGETISIVFAGERTWGDSPSGAGYSLFRSISGIPGMEDLLGLF
jgi:hypothetical protein